MRCQDGTEYNASYNASNNVRREGYAGFKKGLLHCFLCQGARVRACNVNSWVQCTVHQGWDIHEFWAINTCIYVYLYGYAYIWTKYI